jgi:GcrA cell cycle regulator
LGAVKLKSGDLRNMTWTDERIEILKKLWADGLSASQIATELGGVTRNAVIGKVHRLGLSGRAKGSASTVPRVRKPVTRSSPARTIQQHTTSYATRGNAALKPIMMTETALVALQDQRVEEVVVAMSRRISIMELRDGVCKWPLGDPMSADFVYCGADSEKTAVYCTCHSRMAYQPTQDRRRAEARQ